MIIHTEKLIKGLGFEFLDEGVDSFKIFNNKDKIKFILQKNNLSTQQISSKLSLKRGSLNKCLKELKLKKEIKKIDENIINNPFWELITPNKIRRTVPKEKIMAFYSNNNMKEIYRNNYFIFPKKIYMKKKELISVGFFDAEGTKKKEKSVEIVNSEPMLMDLFINFLNNFNITKDQLSYRIVFNIKLTEFLKRDKKSLEKVSEKFWRIRLSLPENKVIKFNHAGSKEGRISKNIIEYGSLNIVFNKVLFRKFLFSLINETKKAMTTNEDIGNYLKGYISGEAYVGRSDREIQIASNDKEHLDFIRRLFEVIGVRSSISKETSTAPPRLIITRLSSFLTIDNLNLFEFHNEKRKNLIIKILNYKSIENNKRRQLKRKLNNLKSREFS